MFSTQPKIDELKKLYLHKKALFIDIREKEEWEEEHLTDSVHYPFSKIIESPKLFFKEQQIQHAIRNNLLIFLFCVSGNRAKKAFYCLKKDDADFSQSIFPISYSYQMLIEYFV